MCWMNKGSECRCTRSLQGSALFFTPDFRGVGAPEYGEAKTNRFGPRFVRQRRLFSEHLPFPTTREYEMNPEHPIRVLSIDDHPLLSEGIATMINNEPDMKLVATASTAKDGIAKYREVRPDVTLMDLRLPDISGIEALIAIRSEFPDARIILLTMFAGD